MNKQEDDWFEKELDDAIKSVDKWSASKKKHFARVDKAVYKR